MDGVVFMERSVRMGYIMIAQKGLPGRNARFTFEKWGNVGVSFMFILLAIK